MPFIMTASKRVCNPRHLGEESHKKVITKGRNHLAMKALNHFKMSPIIKL